MTLNMNVEWPKINTAKCFTFNSNSNSAYVDNTKVQYSDTHVVFRVYCLRDILERGGEGGKKICAKYV